MISAHANTNTQLGASKTDANEQDATGQETGRQLRERLRVKERAFQTMWKRTFDYSFRANETCTPDEVAVMEMKYAGKGGNKKENLMRAEPTAVRNKAGKTPASNVEPVVPAIQVEQIQAVSKQGSPLLLWSCLLLSLACSIPNMYEVALAMKGNVVLAGLVTAAFTIAPFLLIAYGIKGPLQYAAYVPILVEIFCNSAGFFGGMTGLSHSLYIKPTPFLHMVTSMTNSANGPTAFLLAGCMAACIAILAIVPVYLIEKRGK